MSDLYKANKVKEIFDKFVEWGYSDHESAKEATHDCGISRDGDGQIFIAHCGEYIVLFDCGRSSIYKAI